MRYTYSYLGTFTTGLSETSWNFTFSRHVNIILVRNKKTPQSINSRFLLYVQIPITYCSPIAYLLLIYCSPIAYSINN